MLALLCVRIYTYHCLDLKQAVMEMMMMTQYFDTIRNIGTSQNSHTVFCEHQPGAVSDLASQIRTGFLQASAPQPPTMTR